MGILVKPTKEKKIVAIGIDSNEVELKEAYVRLEYSARADGKTFEIATETYFNKAAFKKGVRLSSNLNVNSGTIQLKEGEIQDLATAFKYICEAFELQGYICEVA